MKYHSLHFLMVEKNLKPLACESYTKTGTGPSGFICMLFMIVYVCISIYHLPTFRLFCVCLILFLKSFFLKNKKIVILLLLSPIYHLLCAKYHGGSCAYYF